MTLPKRPLLRHAIDALGHALGRPRRQRPPARTQVSGLSRAGAVRLDLPDGRGGLLARVEMRPADRPLGSVRAHPPVDGDARPLARGTARG